MNRKMAAISFLLCGFLLAPSLVGCQKQASESASSSQPIQGLSVDVVDNDVFEIGEACSYAVSLPSGATGQWRLINSDGGLLQEGKDLTSSFKIEYSFTAYGNYSLSVSVSMGASSFEKTYTLHCLDITPASIVSLPSEKTIEAGTLYSFKDDLATIVAKDNSSTPLDYRVVRILYQDQSVINGHSIASYQFKNRGDYTIEVEVNDLNENVSRGQYQLHVQDTTSPKLSGESAYDAYFDSDYNITLPKISIEEFSPYTTSYRLVSLDGYDVSVSGDQLLAPHIGTYSLTYTVSDALNPASSFSTRLTVKNNAPSFAFSNTLGSVYDATPFTLPAPVTSSLSGATYRYSASQTGITISGNKATITSKGTYSIHCALSATYYLGGEKHKEDGSKAMSFEGDISVEVSSRGSLDMESHNGVAPVVWNSSDSNTIALAPGQGVDGSTALEYDTLLIGWNRFASLLEPIPAPDSFDGLRVWVKCGGVNPKGFMYVILEDTLGEQTRADFYINPLVGQYYMLPLSGSKITNIKRICIANRLGENGETVTDPETGAISSIGEDRSFYLDDLSLVTMPTLNVDLSSLSPVMVAGDSLSLPKEKLSNWSDSYSCVITSLHAGKTSTVTGYTIAGLEEGEYTFTYTISAGGATLTKSFSVTVYPKKTAVVLYNNYGLLRVGESAALPEAYLIAMEGKSVKDGTYSLAYEQEASVTVSGSLPALKQGSYTISYSIAYAGTTYHDSFTFKVAGAPSMFTFDAFNNGTDGEIQEVIGNASPTAEIKDGSLHLGGWWGGALFKEDLTLTGMTDFYLNVLSKTGLTHTAVYYLDQTRRSGSMGWHSTEDLGIFYDLPANTMTTIHIEIPSSVTAICAFAVLTMNTEVEVDKVWLEAKASKIPAGETGIFGLSNYVPLTPLDVTKLTNDPSDDALRIYGQWVCSFTIAEGLVAIPASATKATLKMKANQAYDGLFIRLTSALGILYDDETAGISISKDYVEYPLALSMSGTATSLTKCEFWVQDDNNAPGWKVLTISSFLFGGSNA